MGTVFVLPILVPYYQEELGLTFQDLMIGEAVFASVIIAMEIPSGWLSDVWNRKYTLMVGSLCAVIGYMALMNAVGFWSALVSQAILGIGVAFNSGTVTSILYDSLAEKGKEDLYQKLEGKRHGIGLYAVAIGAISGGLLYQINPRLPLFLDIITLLLAVICISLLQEPKRIKRRAQHHPVKDMLITMKYALYDHKEIAGIIIVSTILFATTKMFMWSQQPYMQLVDIPTKYFGYVMGFGFLLGGLIGHFGHKVKHSFSNRHTIMALTCIPILSAICAVLIPVKSSILFLLILPAVWGYGFPFVQNAIQKHADPTRRATILSTLGLLISLVAIPMGLIIGYLDDVFSIRHSLGYLAIQLLILSSIGFYIWIRAKKTRS